MTRLFLWVLCFVAVGLKGGAQSPPLAVADSLYALGNYTAAITEYNKYPSPGSRMQVARAYHAIGNYEKALGQYENLVAEYPDMPVAQNELGKLYLKIKQFEKARDVFLLLTEKEYGSADNFYLLGKSYQYIAGESGYALPAFKQAFRKDTTHLKSIYETGKYYLKNREKDSVLKYVDKGLTFYPNSVELINLKALALFNNGNHREASPWFERLTALGEEKPYIYERLGDCYVRLIAYEKAVIAYETALKLEGLNPNPKTLLALGKIHLKLKDYEKAAAYTKEAIAVQQVTFESEYETLANIVLEQKQVKEGLEYLKLAYEEDPESTHLYYRICLVADNYYVDPKLKLRYYEDFMQKTGDSPIVEIYKAHVSKRISALRQEIHLGAKAE
ncbi:Tetratricopeptide repeat-containing protein [Sinomicrobium oceani]|uniref:Tetratricopeptide repeat-containing protein n=1 Tax=Sinomicrobium oceani TaxID=1150368 RepID=A0A1K1NGH3_9FLAO|nr:tetratricopeptide repeat protein [Sinomicrobium oceani]SFW33510.1 Tetratricopeptide repeat-containing protein [Sinomicrobium oceani]